MGDSILLPPTLSSSSMKITQGALALASPTNKKSTQQLSLLCLVSRSQLKLENRGNENVDVDVVIRKILLKRFLMRLAPTPTNISSNSEPEA